ncbi:MAG TPA: hypothetical protein VFS43_38085, partial [Polyangiaceae bacterium]|nr:hypothetical protein [Polyangiaceae bacterium]
LRGHILSSAVSATNPSASGTIAAPGPFGAVLASASLSVGQAWDVFSTFSFKKTSGTGTDGVSAFLALLVAQPDATFAEVRGSNVWTSPASVGVFLPYGMRGRFVATQAGTHQLRVTAASVTSSISYETAGWSTDHYVMGSA